MKKYFILIILVKLILLVCIFYVLNWNTNLKHQLTYKQKRISHLKESMKNYEIYIKHDIFSNTFVGLKIPIVEMTDINGSHYSTDFSKHKAGIILIFTPNACQPCLRTQLKMLKHFNENLKKSIKICAITDVSAHDAKAFVRALSLDFPIISDIDKRILKSPFIDKTPLVLAVNNDNFITHSHIPPIKSPHLSLAFYLQLNYLGITKSLFQLDDTSILDIVNNNFNESKVDHLFY